jgi:subtilisin family serine protease
VLLGLDVSTGPKGANATGLGLSGAGIRIGQIEPGRPGIFGFDGNNRFNRAVTPVAVFRSVFNPVSERGTHPHAEQVAGIMISRRGPYRGMSRDASLFASDTTAGPRMQAVPVPVERYNEQINVTAALQKVIDAGGGVWGLRAVNMSLGVLPVQGGDPGNPVLDGTDPLTLASDWAGFTNDFLPIVSGEQIGPGAAVPTDNYNGITVGMLRQDRFDRLGTFNQVDPANVFTIQRDGRRLIGLVAPGIQIASSTFGNRFTPDRFTDANNNRQFDQGNFVENNGIAGDQFGESPWIEAGNNAVQNSPADLYFDPNFDGMRNGAANDDFLVASGNPNYPAPHAEAIRDEDTNGIIDFRLDGTSFAAPHVTGAVALIQQEAQGSTIAQRHEVIKAVLLNSADKRSGAQSDMGKTIRRTDGRDWIQQYDNEGVTVREQHPMDLQLGTGALNVGRAQKQIASGRQGPGSVPLMGWDANVVRNGEPKRYEIADPLLAGSYIAVTLCWDRIVDLDNRFGVINHYDAEMYLDGNGNGMFDPGETLHDLDGDNDFQAENRDEFRLIGLSNLNLYLVPHGAGIDAAVARSISTLYNLEHLFFRVPENRAYDLIVRFESGAGGRVEDSYAIAWWSIPEPGGVGVLTIPLIAVRRSHRSRLPRDVELFSLLKRAPVGYDRITTLIKRLAFVRLRTHP